MKDLEVRPFLCCALVIVGLVGMPLAAYAITVPGSADVGRVKPEENLPPPDHSQDQRITVPAMQSSAPVPKGVREIHFVLKGVTIEGMTVFTPEQMADIYTPYLHKDVPLEVAWTMVGQITERYRKAGYFLASAYVPQQQISNGILTLRVIEGYIGKVELPEDIKGHSVVQGYIDRLLAQRPTTTNAVESFLLRMNDLPGYTFRSVLSSLDEQSAADAPVMLTLVPVAKDDRGSLTFDNFSSRYLGPNELSASYSASLLPLQQTTVSGLSSLPTDTLRYGMIDHTVILAPALTLDVNGGVTKAYPGYTLKQYEIDSTATSESIGLQYQWMRQRQENLLLKATLDNRDVTSDILGTPLTRDHIHALRVGGTYDTSDAWQGYDTLTATLSQGINAFGASQKNDLNLSRAGAIPDFFKAELSISRQQSILTDWSVQAAASGQWTPDTLYSSEQYGYGGQAFGRAYDASEITGDRGISGSLELRYDGWGAIQPVSLQPYLFYDAGETWNVVGGASGQVSGQSAGLGMRFSTVWHQTGNLGLAWPLGRTITDPIYGTGADGPRILLQFGQEF